VQTTALFLFLLQLGHHRNKLEEFDVESRLRYNLIIEIYFTQTSKFILLYCHKHRLLLQLIVIVVAHWVGADA